MMQPDSNEIDEQIYTDRRTQGMKKCGNNIPLQ